MLYGEREIRPQQAQFGYLEDSGASIEMAVDGSLTAVDYKFYFQQDAGRHFKLINSVLTISGGKIDNPANFSGLATPLTNGLILGWLVQSDAGETKFPSIIPLKTSYDIVSFASESRPWGFDSTTQDVLVAEFFLDYKPTLDPKQITGLYLTVQDNLSTLDSMRMAVRGYNT